MPTTVEQDITPAFGKPNSVREREQVGVPGRLQLIKAGALELYCELAGMDSFNLATRLTLMLLVLYSGDYWYLRAPMAVVCTCGILFSSLHRSASYWMLIGLVMVWGNFLNWYTIDNHKYLMTYWTLAVYFCLMLPRPAISLAWNARMLIGLCFAFSVLWKCISGDFLDGSFFHYTLLNDNRFRGVAEVFGATNGGDFHYNKLAVAELVRFDSPISMVTLREGTRIATVAQVLTWWTILIETLIAAAFLLPTRTLLARWRHLLLICFAVTTYVVAPVIGFGWLLMVMGVAQCDPELKKTRALYVITFFALQIFTSVGKYAFDLMKLFQ
jgi:hypothetical protein